MTRGRVRADTLHSVRYDGQVRSAVCTIASTCAAALLAGCATRAAPAASVPDAKPEPGAVVFVVDTTGSMARVLPEVRAGVCAAIDRVAGPASIGVVTFGQPPHGDYVIAPGGGERARRVVEALRPAGHATGRQAVEIALDMLRVRRSAVRAVVFVTDSPGELDLLHPAPKRARAEGVRLVLVAVGAADGWRLDSPVYEGAQIALAPRAGDLPRTLAGVAAGLRDAVWAAR